MAEIYIGLMSGTSLDGVDGVLADFAADRIAVRAHATAPFPAGLRAELLALNEAAGIDELHRAALAANALAGLYAQVVHDLIGRAGHPASEVRAIGAHGQTVRHRPAEFDGTGYTLQINHPALLAELTGIDVVADFRSRDLAAGGQGAPLAPAFHAHVFGRPDQAVAVLNLGGIANLSLLPAGADPGSTDVLGFDCGPANALLDHWIESHRGLPFDADGAWAAGGQVHAGLLARLLSDPYFARPAPKSTGRDLFHPGWLASALAAQNAAIAPEDVQATLAELTAASVADALEREAGGLAGTLIVCGGGALNGHLMRRLAARLPGTEVLSSDQRGLPPQQVEATAFAWLARRTLRREPGNLPRVTGARGPRVLGAIYWA